MEHRDGRLIAEGEIRRRLDRGEIFRPGSWDPRNVRATGYDLRMARDLLIVPGKQGKSRQYTRGQERASEAILETGDVAVVTSREQLCFPWDISGLIGTKFGLSAKAVLTLTGTIVDPGYGLRLEGAVWKPKDDARLHFMLANVGPEPVSLIPGETRIAVLQFFEVKPADRQAEIDSGGFREIESRFFDQADSSGLEFFHQIKIQVSDNKREIESINSKLDVIEKSSNQIVMFGLYLLLITFIGASLSFTLSVFSNIHDAGPISNVGYPQSIGLFVALIIFASVGAIFLVDRAWRHVRGLMSGRP